MWLDVVRTTSPRFKVNDDASSHRRFASLTLLALPKIFFSRASGSLPPSSASYDTERENLITSCDIAGLKAMFMVVIPSVDDYYVVKIDGGAM